MAAFVGTWEHASEENLEVFMKAMGLPAEVKRLIDRLVISVDGDTWTFNNIVGENQNKVTLKVGKMVEYSMPPTTMKGIIKSVGDQVVEEHFNGDMKTTMVREIVKGQMCCTSTANGVTAKVFYDKK